MNLALILESTAREHPARTALKSPGASFTYAELDALASRIALGLQANGIAEGDKVAISCPTIPAFAFAYYGILKLGAVAVPLNLLLKPAEIAAQLQAADVRAYICFEGTAQFPMGSFGLAGFEAAPCCRHFFVIPASPEGLSTLGGQRSFGELLASAGDRFDSVQVGGDTTCSISFTSGTTGTAKGTEHTHFTEYLSSVLVRDELNITAADTSLSALPLFSLWRCAILHATFLAGGTVVLLPRFDPVEVWQTMAREKITYFYGVPAMFHAMHNTLEASGVDADTVARHWRACAFGGAPFDPELRGFFRERFELDMRQGYGLTEIVFAVLDAAKDSETPGLIGRPIPGVQVRIVDEDLRDVPEGEMGEIVVRSPTVMKGYFNHPEWTEEANRGGWFHTGDLGRRDADGNLYLVDRIKDMINRGGFKIYPAEVEPALRQHPAVANLALIGIADERLGEEVLAFVVLREGAELAEEAFVEWARERVASHAYPRKVVFIDALPMSPTGKVIKRLLREELHAGSS